MNAAAGDGPDPAEVARVVAIALAEDRSARDVTTTATVGDSEREARAEAQPIAPSHPTERVRWIAASAGRSVGPRWSGGANCGNRLT